MSPRPAAIMPARHMEYYMRICVFGEPGVGKTVLAASGRRTLLLLDRLDEVSSIFQFGYQPDIVQIDSIDRMQEMYDYIRHEGYKEYDWVWIDNATLIQDIFMDQVMEELVANPKNAHRNRWVPDQHEYLVVQNQLSTFIRNFSALPIHFGWTAHALRAADEDDRVLYIPLIQGGRGDLSQKLCGWMNVVAHHSALYQDDTVTRRQINVTKRGKFYAKSRWSGLQGTIVDPTIPKIMRAVMSDFPQLGNPPTAVTANKAAAGKVAAAKKAAAVKKTTAKR